jgi:imidazolonepropionase-like amidohydrolase
MRSLRLASLLGALSGLLSSAACQTPPTGRIALTNVTVIDGTGSAPQPGRAILIDRGRISAIQPASTPIPAGYVVSDFTGRFVIPGLIDSHVHVGSQPRPPEIIEAILRNVFLGGVTTVRDMGGQAEMVMRLSSLSMPDSMPMPRIHFSTVVAGPGMWLEGERAKHFTGGGSPGETPTVRRLLSEADIKPAVAAAKAAGATGIKIYNSIEPALVRAVIAEAKRHGLRVWSHTSVDPNLPSTLVEAGSEVLSHADQIVAEVVPPAARTMGAIAEFRAARQAAFADSTTFTSLALRNLFSLMKARGAMLEPTLYVMRPAPDSQGRTPRQAGSLYDAAARFTALAWQAGVDIAAGTDAIGGSTPNLHVELQLLVDDAGMTPLQALRSATQVGARTLGISDSIGTIEPGKRADLVILAADPSVDIANTISVVSVYKAGHRFDRARPMPTPPGARRPHGHG